MNSLNFSTPIIHDYPANSWRQSVSHFIEEKTDAYFSLTRGYKAYIISPNQTEQGEYHIELRKGDESLFWKVIANALKIASWFTIAVPLCMLTIKFLYRFEHHLYPIAKNDDKEESSEEYFNWLLGFGEELHEAFNDESDGQRSVEQTQKAFNESDGQRSVEQAQIKKVVLVKSSIFNSGLEEELQKSENGVVEVIEQVEGLELPKAEKMEAEEFPDDSNASLSRLGSSWIEISAVDLSQDPPTSGSFARRKAYYFELFKLHLKDWVGVDPDNVAVELMGLLQDKNIRRQQILTPPVKVDEKEVSQISHQFLVDLTRNELVTINDQPIEIKKDLDDVSKQREALAEVLKHLQPELLDKLSYWMNQYLVGGVGIELMSGLGQLMLDEVTHSVSQENGDTFHLIVTDNQILLQNYRDFKIKDVFFSSDRSRFTDVQEDETGVVGYIEVSQWMSMDIEDLLSYTPEKGIPSFKCDRLISDLISTEDYLKRPLLQ